MSDYKIVAKDAIATDNSGNASAITAETWSTKRGLHVAQIGLSNIFDAALLLIQGTIPGVNFNEIQMTTESSTSFLLDFLYNDVEQFAMRVTNPNGDFNIVFVNKGSIALESGTDVLLTESGFELLLEGA